MVYQVVDFDMGRSVLDRPRKADNAQIHYPGVHSSLKQVKYIGGIQNPKLRYTSTAVVILYS